MVEQKQNGGRLPLMSKQCQVCGTKQGAIVKKIILLLAFMIIGCSPRTFITHYDTEVSPNVSTDKFKFLFKGIPNGLIFEIKNVTETPAILNWVDQEPQDRGKVIKYA